MNPRLVALLSSALAGLAVLALAAPSLLAHRRLASLARARRAVAAAMSGAAVAAGPRSVQVPAQRGESPVPGALRRCLSPVLGRPDLSDAARRSVALHAGVLLLSVPGMSLLGAGAGAWLAWLVAVVATLSALRRSVARGAAGIRRMNLLEASEVLQAELLAGRNPAAALSAAADVAPAALRPAAEVAVLGGDAADLLLRASAYPGAESLRSLSAAWAVATASGAPLAGMLRAAVTGLRAKESLRQEVHAQLAPVRATARLLAALPVVAALLGTGFGASPVQLLTTGLGQACLLAATALTVLGLGWLGWLVRTADPDSQ